MSTVGLGPGIDRLWRVEHDKQYHHAPGLLSCNGLQHPQVLSIPGTLFRYCFGYLTLPVLAIIIDSMIRIEDIHPILGWQKRYLTAMHVVGIDHDGPYDHIVGRAGRRPIVFYIKKNAECGLEPADGHANLIAVMADGSRVMIPDNPEDMGPFPSYVDPGQAHPDEATRIIMTMTSEYERVNAILAFLSPNDVGRILNGKYSKHPSLSNYAYDIHSSYNLVKVDRKFRADAFRFWLELSSGGHFIEIGRALDLEVFIDPDGPLTVDMVPESIIRELERTENGFTSGIMKDIRLKDFKGNDHLAWSIVSHALSDDGKTMASSRTWKLVHALAGPYSSHEESVRFNRFFDDDEDIKGMSAILGIVKLDEPVSLDWVLGILEKGRSCNWNTAKFISLMSRGNGPIASRIRATLVEAMDKHTDWDGSADDESDYDKWDYGYEKFAPYLYEDMYGNREALRGAELLRDESMIGMGPEDEPDDDGRRSIMELFNAVLNIGNCSHGHYSGDFHIMTFLEDVSRAHDLGISVMDLQNVLADYDFHSGNGIDNDLKQLKLVHWMVNLRPEYAHLPYSFYSQLPEYQDLFLA